MLTVHDTVPASAECEVGFTRLIDAPKELVFQVWTDPKHMAKWWGPKIMTNPVCELDVRVGGSLTIVMQAPDGTQYPMNGTFEEVDPPKRLVFLSHAIGEGGKAVLASRATVTFEEQDGKTRLTVHAKAHTLDPIAVNYLRGMEMGWSQSLDLLEDYLHDVQPSDGKDPIAEREIVITRLLDAPRELVYKVWTEPGHMAKWWGPKGFTTTVHSMDVRPGGTSSYIMHGPDGVDYDNLVTYLEVEPPERLTYLHGDSTNPEMFRGAITFEDYLGKTYVTLRNVLGSAAERAAMIEKVGAIEGGNSTLDCLEEYLKQISA